jgi:hypothetical protein
MTVESQPESAMKITALSKKKTVLFVTAVLTASNAQRAPVENLCVIKNYKFVSVLDQHVSEDNCGNTA